MTSRTLVVSASNLLARGFMVIPTDRRSPDGDPVNGLFAVARGIRAAVAMKAPARAVAVIDPTPPATWPDILQAHRIAIHDTYDNGVELRRHPEVGFREHRELGVLALDATGRDLDVLLRQRILDILRR